MMHPRNKYCKNTADFEKLGEKYPEFRKHLLPTSSGYTINFRDPKALRELTVSLLREDFGLNVELPLNRLIPTVTLRLNYILWIEDLIQMLPKGEMCQIRGIDIGTGASCIYPLLGAKINGWKFCASEIDEMSYRFACENVKRNHLEEDIQVRLVTPDAVLTDLLTECEAYDFCMCNPPFFADKSEIIENHSRTGSRPQPNSVCTGTESETVTLGGEIVFVGRIIDDSLKLGTRIKWYTTMLGKKSSLKSVVAKLRQNNISNITTTEFCQGRTMRWGVAWTFLSDVVIKCTSKKKKSKPLRFSFSAKAICPDESFSEVENIGQLILRVSDRFKEMLNELQIQILSETAENTEDVRSIRLHCSATRNTWANQRRKRREAAGKLKTNDAPSSSNVSGVSFESCKTESEMDHAETTKPGQKNISAVNTVSSNENLCSKTALALTNKSMDDKVVAVRDSADVICLKRALELGEMIAIATTKHPVSPDDETQNCQTPKSEKKNTTLQTSTDKISTLHTKRKETAHPETSTRKHKFLKSDEIPKNKQLFLEFHATIGVEHVDFMPDGFPQTYLQMVWISGSDKNCMYQLFQYFQNRLSS